MGREGGRMISLVETIHQYVAIYCFIVLTGCGGLQKNYDLGMGLNFGLVLLYIFLYLQPISKALGK